MDTRTLELAEFLLARTADEEAAVVEYCRQAARFPSALDDLAERVLAECQAKQSIVREWHETEAPGLAFAIAALAASYSGHAEYPPAD